MKPKFYLSCLLGLIALAAHGQDKSTAKETATKPIACKLTTPELHKRKATVIAELKALSRPGAVHLQFRGIVGLRSCRWFHHRNLLRQLLSFDELNCASAYIGAMTTPSRRTKKVASMS